MTMLKLSKDAKTFLDYPLIQMRNVKDNRFGEESGPDLFLDVHILVTHGIKHRDLVFLREVQNEDPEDLRENGDFTRLSDVAPYINGFARILYYTVIKKDEKGTFNPLMERQDNIVSRIEEGRFEKGQLDGFGRILSGDGHHQIGFFKNGHPYGKL